MSLEARDRIAGEAVAAVYRTTVVAVWAAAGASILLAAVMVRLGFTTAETGLAFASYICVCATLHVLLRMLFLRSETQRTRWKDWGRAYAVCCLLEGIGWGWAPVRLVASADFEAELLCVIVLLGLIGGAIPAFGPYRPAFLAFFLPATVPYAVHAAESGEPIRQAATLLMILYASAMAAIGFMLHRAFVAQISLRFQADELADKLMMQVAVSDAANRAKSTFLAAASHDLRQPVHALSLFVGALRRTRISREADEIVQHIERSTRALDGLFAALLDISRLDAGTVELDRRSFELGPLLTRLGQETDAAAIEKRIALKVRIPRSPIVVDSDPVLLERILRNIVENAVKYTQRGRVLVTARRRGSSCVVQVWDTGAGIPASEHTKIFEEYYQVGNPERDRSQGLGLGLAIVRRLTALLACKLTLRSEVGRGSVFTVELPMATTDRAILGDEERSLPYAVRGQMIVVVDDEADIRTGMSLVLTGWGHDVVTASSGREALDHLADRPAAPDLVISDFRLRQNESGIDVVDMLRSEYNKTIPAILITGDTSPDRLIQARGSGLLLLHKPVSSGRLRAAIANTLLRTGD